MGTRRFQFGIKHLLWLVLAAAIFFRFPVPAIFAFGALAFFGLCVVLSMAPLFTYFAWVRHLERAESRQFPDQTVAAGATAVVLCTLLAFVLIFVTLV
jgi:uncharacterized membrane protein